MVDTRRVQFHLKEPWADFITFYGTTATSAGGSCRRSTSSRSATRASRRRRSAPGPYRVVSFQPGVELQLEAFEGYWRKAPSVKKLIFRSLPDETTRAAALKRGDVDVAYFLNGPIAEDVRRTPGLRLIAVRSNTIFFLDFRGQWDAGLALARPAGAHRREPRHRSARDQRGRAARLRRASPATWCRARSTSRSRSTPIPTIRPGPSGCSRRPASRAGSTRATSPSRRPTRARARPSPTTWPRSASG